MLPEYLIIVCTKSATSLIQLVLSNLIVEERFLEDSEKIVDIVATWDKETEDYEKKNEKIDFRIYLKLQLFYNYNEADVDTITMVYVQVTFSQVACIRSNQRKV